MSILTDDERNVAAAVTEGMRLRTLSNEELVKEYLGLADWNNELHIEEMMTRLWPEWANPQC